MSQKEYSDRWYSKNRETQKERVKRRRKEIQVWLLTLKTECSVCGEGDPICLDWHHVREEKETNIASVVTLGWGKERILKEIAKCDLLCANCHRKEHARLVVTATHAPCKR